MPVFRIRGNVEQHVAVRRVGVVLRDQFPAHRDDRADVLRRLGNDVWRLDAEFPDVLVIRGRIARRDDLDWHFQVRCGGIDLVVDVGYVARIYDMPGAVVPPEQARQQAEHDRTARVADWPLAGGIVAGVLADALAGDPRRGHPVALFGKAATLIEGRLYADGKMRGAAFTACCG